MKIKTRNNRKIIKKAENEKSISMKNDPRPIILKEQKP
jgi:hypothetical protein